MRGRRHASRRSCVGDRIGEDLAAPGRACSQPAGSTRRSGGAGPGTARRGGDRPAAGACPARPSWRSRHEAPAGGSWSSGRAGWAARRSRRAPGAEVVPRDVGGGRPSRRGRRPGSRRRDRPDLGPRALRAGRAARPPVRHRLARAARAVPRAGRRPRRARSSTASCSAPGCAAGTPSRGCRPGGSITFITGVAVVRPPRAAAMVTAAFAGVEALTRALALELGPMRVNTIRPGYTDSEMWGAGHATELRAKVAEGLPTGRIGEPEDIAHAALFLMTQPPGHRSRARGQRRRIARGGADMILVTGASGTVGGEVVAALDGHAGPRRRARPVEGHARRRGRGRRPRAAGVADAGTRRRRRRVPARRLERHAGPRAPDRARRARTRWCCSPRAA